MSRHDLPRDLTLSRARNAAFTRAVRNGERSADDPEVLATAEDLRIAKLVSRIDKAIDDAPALTDAQRERIASILRAGVAS